MTNAECEQYRQEYDAELQAARACKDKDKSCMTLVPLKLAGCGSSCTTFVDKDNKLAQVRKKWTDAGCTVPACSQPVSCGNPISALCGPISGLCVDFPGF